MADAVFRRRDEYVASVKRKKRIALNVSLSLCACTLAVIGAFGIWKLGVVEPDPTIIGTKPQHIVETTETQLNSLPVTSSIEGNSEQATQHVSGNKASEPQASTKPSGLTPQATGTVKPSVKPNVNPTIPLLPSIPVGPQLPQLPQPPSKPTPPTVILPTVPAPVVTDPVEEPTTEGGLDSSTPPKPSVKPTRPAPMVTEPTEGDVAETVCPTMAPDIAWPDEATDPPVVQPTWIPEEPTTAVCNTYPPTMPATETPCGPEQAPPTEPPRTEDDCPPTSPGAKYFAVEDLSGKGLQGAIFGLYYNGELIETAVSSSSGSFTFHNMYQYRDMYVVQISAPNGYGIDSHIIYIGKTPSSDYLFINPKI